MWRGNFFTFSENYHGSTRRSCPGDAVLPDIKAIKWETGILASMHSEGEERERPEGV